MADLRERELHLAASRALVFDDIALLVTEYGGTHGGLVRDLALGTIGLGATDDGEEAFLAVIVGQRNRRADYDAVTLLGRIYDLCVRTLPAFRERR